MRTAAWLIFALVLDVTTVQAQKPTWNLSQNLRASNNEISFNQGSNGVWYFMESASEHHIPSTYSFLPVYVAPCTGGIREVPIIGVNCWRDISLQEQHAPLVGVNFTNQTQVFNLTDTIPPHTVWMSRYMSALLNASNQPGYLFFSGNTFQQLYCPKCVYVGECFKDSPATSNSVRINLGGSALIPSHGLPAKEEITSFQNRLLSYRLLNHDQVAAANFRVSGFRPEISIVADVLAAAIVDDVELQRGIMEVLKDRDEQSRVDRATGVNGLVLRAVLFHCHQKDQRTFVREIAATANRFYAEDGESLKVSSETVGHVLKYLGLYSRRLGNAGRGLMFDKATQSHAHSLGRDYDVLTFETTCEYCHQLQQPQLKEVVQDVQVVKDFGTV